MTPQIIRGECVICFSSVYSEQLDSPQRFYSTPCNHHFHFECLQRWSQTNNNCPICRYQNVMHIPNHIQDENLLPPVSQQMIREYSNQVNNENHNAINEILTRLIYHNNNINNILNSIATLNMASNSEPLVTRQLAFNYDNNIMRPRHYNMLPITRQNASNNLIEVD